MSSGKAVYFPFIDGLRALAVISVIIFHLNEHWLPGGFIGVDIFFVISGFVVSASLANFDRTRLREFLWFFYARRMQRILPALILCLLTFSVLSAVFIPQAWLSDTNQNTAFWAFFGLSNYVLAAETGDYFAPVSEFNPFTHTWSLGVEEQFYLAFPILFFLWARHHASPRDKHISMLLFFMGFSASLLYAAWIVEKNATLGFYSIASRFWELAIGVLLFQFLQQLRGRVLPTAVFWPVLVVSIILLIAGFLYAQPDRFPWPWALLPVLGTAGVIGALVMNPNNPVHALLAHTLPSSIGKISYSLYLWHWPVIVLMRWTVGIELAWQVGLAVGMTILSATLSYHFVEKPIRYARFLKRMPRNRVVFVSMSVVVLAVGLNQWVAQHQNTLSASVTADIADWYPELRPWNPESDCVPGLETRGLTVGSVTHFTTDHCEKAHTRRLFVIGDSHAGAYLPLLQTVSESLSTDVLLYTQAGCAFLSLSTPHQAMTDGCKTFVEAASEDLVQHLQPGDVLFLPSLRISRFAEQFSLFPESDVEASTYSQRAVKNREQAIAEAYAWLSPLTLRGIHVLFEAPKPVFKAPPFRCSDTFNANNPICHRGLTMEKAALERLRAPLLREMNAMAQRLDYVSVWDPFSILCPGAVCEVKEAGRPLYFDADHLSGYGNTVLFPSFQAHLSALLDQRIETDRRTFRVVVPVNREGDLHIRVSGPGESPVDVQAEAYVAENGQGTPQPLFPVKADKKTAFTLPVSESLIGLRINTQSAVPADQILLETEFVPMKNALSREAKEAVRYYFALLGVPPDRNQLAHWAARVHATNNDLTQILRELANSDEFQKKYRPLDAHQQVEALYKHLLNRAPDPGGWTYYTNKLAAGEVSLPQIAGGMLFGAKGADARTMENRFGALYCLMSADHPVPPPSQIHDWLEGVGETTESKVAACQRIP